MKSRILFFIIKLGVTSNARTSKVSLQVTYTCSTFRTCVSVYCDIQHYYPWFRHKKNRELKKALHKKLYQFYIKFKLN